MLFKHADSVPYNAAFYVQNTTDNSATVNLSFFDSAGNLNCLKTVTLAAKGSVGYWLPSLNCAGTNAPEPGDAGAADALSAESAGESREAKLPDTSATADPASPTSSPVTIEYAYDALNRLTNAIYSNGTAFHYTYDAVGNVLEYVATLNGISTTTTYTYDAANQLLTATKDSTTWHYTYDGNGSLIQSTPGESVSNGAKRYTYSAAGFLVKVETYTNDWQNQAVMAYDGLGSTSTSSVTAAWR